MTFVNRVEGKGVTEMIGGEVLAMLAKKFNVMK